MAYDQFGQMHVTQEHLFNMLYEYPELDLKQFQMVFHCSSRQSK